MLSPGVRVMLTGEDRAPRTIVPSGRHVVSKVNADGSFHVGGNTAVWPSRIVEIRSS